MRDCCVFVVLTSPFLFARATVWAPHLRVCVFQSGDHRRVSGSVHRVLKSGGVLIVTYGLVALHADILGAQRQVRSGADRRLQYRQALVSS